MQNENFEYVNHKIEFSPKLKTGDEIEKENKQRCIAIEKKVINKVILGQFFFSTDRFAKLERISDDTEIFYFNEETEIKTEELRILKDFLKTLQEKYSTKLYQIDNFIDDNKEVKREIKYKVQILKITNEFIRIRRKYGGFEPIR